jgi:hypothetical protein
MKLILVTLPYFVLGFLLILWTGIDNGFFGLLVGVVSVMLGMLTDILTMK